MPSSTPTLIALAIGIVLMPLHLMCNPETVEPSTPVGLASTARFLTRLPSVSYAHSCPLFLWS